jgi:hypothetical protein
MDELENIKLEQSDYSNLFIQNLGKVRKANLEEYRENIERKDKCDF